MKQVLISLLFFSPALCLNAQKYVLNVQAEPYGNAEKSSFLVIHTEGRNFLPEQILKDKQTFILDTFLTYAHPVEVHYYIDCSEKEIADLNAFGDTEKPHATLNFFLTEGSHDLILNRDTMRLLKPNLVQRRYFQLKSEINRRIDSFDLEIGNELFESFKHAQTQKEKDSIEQLKDILFKVNVARVNLDSSLMYAIQNNLDNPLSLYAMGEYMRVARFLDLDIPKSRMEKLMASMPAQQRNYQAWVDLNDNLGAIPDLKILAGNPAPEFKGLRDPQDKMVHLKDFRGKVVFLDFWASWCGPCKKQLPELKRIYENMRGEKVEFIGISLDYDLNNWKNEIKDSGLKWINISDLKSNNGNTSIMYNVTTIPHNVLINAQGIIVAENIPLDALESKIKEIL